MSHSIDYPPSEWGLRPSRIPGSPDPGVYVHVDGPTGEEIFVWHWHTPTDDDPRWSGARLGLHTVISLDPLHVEPSLGCEHGCPSHGWVRGGTWTDA